MPNDPSSPRPTNRILVKLRPGNSLGAAESRANLRPLYDSAPTASRAFGLDPTPQWFVADMPEAAASPWDTAHARRRRARDLTRA